MRTMQVTGSNQSLMWRQQLQDRGLRDRVGTLTHKLLDVGVTATAFAHILILGPTLRADGGEWALPLAAVAWAGVGSAVACQLLLG